MNVQRFAAFSDNNAGGNPAGVVLSEEMPEAVEMQRIAADVGYSETVFAVPTADSWRVRYFSPETEVPFCGHATIALGAALAIQHGDGVYDLELNDSSITVEGRHEGQAIVAALQSPTTASRAAGKKLVDDALALFGYDRGELDKSIPPAVAEAGAKHLVLAFEERQSLARMAYDMSAGLSFMRANGLVTVNLVHAETSRLIHSRNAFAFGGVYEDPATGAAAAALAGYLRDLGWRAEGGQLTVVQGEDMGMRSILTAAFRAEPGSSIRISGAVRTL